MATIVRKLTAYRPLADVFELVKTENHAVFLDSSLQGETGCFSIVGFEPYRVLEQRGGICREDGIACEAPFLEVLRTRLKEGEEPNPTPLPFVSGAIGYLSYDFGRRFELGESRHAATLDMPEALMVFYDALIIEDHREHALYAAVQGRRMPTGRAINRIERLVSHARPAPAPARGTRLAPFGADFTKDGYKQALTQMMDYMRAGHIYVANMTQQLSTACSGDSYGIYRYLRTHNPAPFSAYLNGGDYQVCCASMERFLHVRAGRVETRPIKGTRKRGDTPAEDEVLRCELASSEKDRSELLMIVDLERNDLSRVCVPGSVRVLRHFDVEAYATVFHLVTTIEGYLEEGKTAIDLVEAAFPGGSITGAPKIRAMEIIDELEHSRRGLYTGSIGYLSCAGDADLNIVIRTAVCQAGRCRIGVGGGITCESDLEFEYEETLQKAKAVLEAIANGGGCA